MIDVVGVTLHVNETRRRPFHLAVGWLEESITAHTLRGRGAYAAEVTGHRFQTDFYIRSTKATFPFEIRQGEARGETESDKMLTNNKLVRIDKLLPKNMQIVEKGQLN